jgi:transposase-like protein
MTENTKLSDLRREAMLLRLASGQSIAKVAREFDCDAKHLSRWLNDGEGLERLDSSLQRARETLESRLPALITKSLDTLEAALSSPFMSPERMQAAKTIVQITARLSKHRCPHCEQRIIDADQ